MTGKGMSDIDLEYAQCVWEQWKEYLRQLDEVLENITKFAGQNKKEFVANGIGLLVYAESLGSKDMVVVCGPPTPAQNGIEELKSRL